ncbi:hypothetical protein DFH09DRAFT_1329039 [Mycena vulgaris]|nr:hypothetical protein DFH09DRAFT_1329039 [Mycena vulgaris]
MASHSAPDLRLVPPTALPTRRAPRRCIAPRQNQQPRRRDIAITIDIQHRIARARPRRMEYGVSSLGRRRVSSPAGRIRREDARQCGKGEEAVEMAHWRVVLAPVAPTRIDLDSSRGPMTRLGSMLTSLDGRREERAAGTVQMWEMDGQRAPGEWGADNAVR